MQSKKDFIDNLHSNEKYKQALASARNDAEREAIKQIVEGFVNSFATVLAPLIEQAQKDPEFAQQLGQSLNEKQVVLSTDGPTTGSIG